MARTGRPPVAPEIRFFRFVIQDGECWTWTGTSNNGYGSFWHGSGRVYAHRWSYEYFAAPIPEGLTIDHLCRNRACVNPAHLDPVPMRVNTFRADSPPVRFASATHCVNGHPFDATSTKTNDRGWRTCRTCERAKDRRYKQKRKAAA